MASRQGKGNQTNGLEASKQQRKDVKEERKEARREKAAEQVASHLDIPESKPHSKNGNENGSVDDKPKASHADKVKFAGLIAFFVVVAAIVWMVWPYIHLLFEEDGLDLLMTKVRSAGWSGILIVEAIQFLQVVVAFIPGEVVQIAAGMLYGPWWGAAVILVGCIFSSALIFFLVHKLGAPFVHDMVPAKYMDKFREFETSGKFELVIFILFLVPGLPKDVFTYITPLSDMKLVPFLVITNVARIPGIVLSTYAADGLLEGRVVESVIMFVALAVVAVLALVFYNTVMNKRKDGK